MVLKFMKVLLMIIFLFVCSSIVLIWLFILVEMEKEGFIDLFVFRCMMWKMVSVLKVVNCFDMRIFLLGWIVMVCIVELVFVFGLKDVLSVLLVFKCVIWFFVMLF